MDMIARVLLVALVLIPFVSAQASKQAPADEEVEYLIPEDWDSKEDEPKETEALQLTPTSFQAGIKKHMKEIPQCAAAKLDKGSPLNDGQVVYHELTLNGAKVEIFLNVSKSGKILNAKFAATNSAKDDAQLRGMLCSTYAVMRTLQPDLESSDAALKSAKTAWERAKTQPFKMGFYFNSIRTQYVPFEMSVF